MSDPECLNLLREYGESLELAFAMLCSGKYWVARSEVEAGREKFRQVIKMGQTFDGFYLVYWGMVNLARTYLVEGRTEKALEISLALKDCRVEYKMAQDEVNCLLADLQATLPEGKLDVVLQQGDGDISAEHARAGLLAYVREHETG